VHRFAASRVSLVGLLLFVLGTTAACGAEKVPSNLLAGWGPGPADCGEYTVSVVMVDSAEDVERVFEVKVDGEVVTEGTLEGKSSSYVKTFTTSKASTTVEIGEVIAYNRSKEENIVQSAKDSPMTVNVTPCSKKK
jgi:hypothetical protein